MAAGLAPAPGIAAQSCPSPASIVAGQEGAMAHVRYLADDALEGRNVASPGERCASEYIAGHFRALGLDPAGDDGFIQTFDVRTGSRLGSRNALSISGNPVDQGKAWRPYGFSGSGAFDGPLAYVGAESDPAVEGEGPDSVDARAWAGRVVVVEGGGASMRDDAHYRASEAMARGAEAVIVLLGEGQALPALEGERRPFLGVPVLAVGAAEARTVREAARGGARASLEVSVEPVLAEARNVAALLPGADPARAGELVIVGGHYDHLGHGGDGSLAPDSREIHNGADDNASGTAALLEVAEALASGPRPSRPVLFLAFSGEEKGLLGSAHYVAEPTRPLDDAVAMINMDMVGRLRQNTLTVYGMATAEEWEEVVGEVNGSLTEPFELSLLPDGFGPSDHSSFYGAGIPVLHLFTNTHSEYHRPDDDWDTLNGPGLDRIAGYVADITAALAGTPERVAVALTPREGAGNPQAASGETSGRGYGPYFGSIPDMSPTEYGLRLSGVREDSPAERAGLRAGDVIVRFGGRDVTDIYAFTYALRDKQPGDRVEVVVERDGQRITMFAVLGERR